LVASYCGIKVVGLVVIGNRVVLDYDSQDFPKFENLTLLEQLINEFIERIS
jgi:hypothetical protein